MGMSTHKIKGEDYYQCRDVKAERDKLLEEVAELLDRLEAAEKERDDVAMQLAQSEQGKRKISEECDTLLARIEQMEKQEPVGTLHDDGCFVWSASRPYESNYAGWKMELYLAPGAKGE